MPALAKSKNPLSKILEDIMQADMGILPEKRKRISEIDEALSALNAVNTDRDRKKVKKNLKQAGEKLFSTSERNTENLDEWARRANIASSCLSLIHPYLAIGISDWVLEKLGNKSYGEKKQGQSNPNDNDITVLKAWAKYNLALAFKEVKGGRDQAEKELKQIQGLMKKWPDDSLMKIAKAAFKLPALIQLCEIHIDRQERTRFKNRKEELQVEILKSTCKEQCKLPEGKCILLYSNTGKHKVDLYRSYIAVWLHLICLEYQILSLRAESRKENSKEVETIVTPCILLNNTIQFLSDKAHLVSLQNKLFLVVLEYMNEALLSISETRLEEKDEIRQGFFSSWRKLVNFIYKQEKEQEKGDGRAERLYPERFEWWPKILETIIDFERKKEVKSEKIDKKTKKLFDNLVDILMNKENDLPKWIRASIEKLLKTDLGGIRKAINQEKMKEPDHRDLAVEKQLRDYRKVIGLFNDVDKFSDSRLRKEEIELIGKFICSRSKDNKPDEWLFAKFCARRRFLLEKLKEKDCYQNKDCPLRSKATNSSGTEKKLHTIICGLFNKQGQAKDLVSISDKYLDNAIKKSRDDFEERLTYHSCHKKMSDRFGVVCLRRWQSYTPTLSAPQKVSRGGGYFVFNCDLNGNVKEGIVIDPGIYFLENFIEEGFSIQDIDAVLLTHSHIDHRDDLESILTLLHEAAEKGVPNNIRLAVTQGAWDDIDSMIRRSREHIDDIYTIEDKETKKDNKNEDQEPIKKNKNNERLIPGIAGSTIKVEWEKAYHECFDADCVGYRLWIDKTLGKGFRFTGDTVYPPNGLGIIGGEDVVMLNLGGLVSDNKGTDNKLWTLEKIAKLTADKKSIGNKKIKKWALETGFLESHLYLAGTLQLLCDWKESLIKEKKTGLAVLCELPEELSGGHRKIIAKAIEESINDSKRRKPKNSTKKIIVLPEDVGLRISYYVPNPKDGKKNNQEEGPQIECLYCAQRVKPKEIEVIPWGLEERLMFVCRDCRKAAEPYLLEEKFKQYRDRGRPFEKAES